MKQKILQRLSALLVLALLLTCLPISVSADTTAPDGVKEAAYTNGKRLKINTTYAGQGQALRDNPYDVSSETFYYWDDNNVYIWYDVYDGFNDGAGVAMLDVLYVRQGTVKDDGKTFLNSGVEWSYNKNTGAYSCNNSMLKYVATANPQTGVRSYEFYFPRGDADGFLIQPVVYGAGNYTVSYGSAYLQPVYAKAVSFTDESTWLDTSAYSGPEIPDLPDPINPNNLVDGVKEEEYNKNSALEVSNAYFGQSGNKRDNPNHVYTRTSYYWDDTHVYFWMDVYDPDNVTTIDAFYYLDGINGIGAIFNLPNGYEVAYTIDDNKLTANKPEKAAITVGETTQGATRSLEIAMPRSADGFLFQPVSYVNASYTVSYGTSYFSTDAAKQVLFGDPSSYEKDTSAIDKDVCNNYELLESIQTALQRLPEDASTLQEKDRALVNEVAAVVETVPASWLNRLDNNLVNRYENALARMLELEAAEKEDDIKGVEQLISALPETVTLANEKAVNDAKVAYDALGKLTQFVNKDLQNKLVQAFNRIATLQSPVKIDGELDPAYSKGQNYDINLEFNMDSASTIIGTDPDTYGRYYTMADEKYIYLYVEVVNEQIIPYEGDGVWLNAYENRYDGLITYFNPDPYNDPYASPIRNNWDAGTKDFSFYMFADGTVDSTYIQEGKTEFLADRTFFVGFTKENGYGYEMRFPRVEGEEEFYLNLIITDPSADPETVPHRHIAVGAEWFANYSQYAQHYLEDYPELKNYSQVIELINALPAADSITTKDLDQQVKELEEALALLNVDQRALVSEDVVKHLTDVRAAIDSATDSPAGTYGDLNGDTKIDAKDALLILKAAVGKATLTDAQKAVADLNGDTKIDAKDALLVLRKAVNKIDKFPVEE